jgi:hypothetical protein
MNFKWLNNAVLLLERFLVNVAGVGIFLFEVGEFDLVFVFCSVGGAGCVLIGGDDRVGY